MVKPEEELEFETKLRHHARYWYVNIPPDLVNIARKVANSSKLIHVRLSKRGGKK